MEAALKGSNSDGFEHSGSSIFAAECYTFACTSASGRSSSLNPTAQPLADPRSHTTQLPSLLQCCISSMLAGEYSVFKVPAGALRPLPQCNFLTFAPGADKEWDTAMQAAGFGSSCYYVQMAMMHFQRRGVCADRSTASVTIVRHSNMWSVAAAASPLQSPALGSVSIGDGTVVTLSYAARSCCSSQWLDVAQSRDVTVGAADLPMGLDAAVRSMQVAELCDVHCSAEDAYAAEVPSGGVPEGIDLKADVVFRCCTVCECARDPLPFPQRFGQGHGREGRERKRGIAGRYANVF